MEAKRKDVYEIVTDKIIKTIEAGIVPWRKPWLSGGAIPKNFISKKAYRGINIWLLFLEGRLNPFWITFKQCQGLGGRVKKGAKGSLVIFWRWLERTEEKEGKIELKRIPLLRYFIIFNCDDCEGLPKEAYPQEAQIAFEPIEKCEELIAGYKDRPEIKHERQQAFYAPEQDYVNLPRKESFESIQAYYAAGFHELTHSTGHPKRLNRSGITDIAPFGSPLYSAEELVAELGSSFLCGLAGIESNTIKNSAAYLQGWLQALKNDKRMLIKAAGQAQKAVDYILGEAVENPEAEDQQEIYLQAA